MWCYENGGGSVCCVCIKDLTLNMRLLLYETPFHIFVKGHHGSQIKTESCVTMTRAFFTSFYQPRFGMVREWIGFFLFSWDVKLW